MCVVYGFYCAYDLGGNKTRADLFVQNFQNDYLAPSIFSDVEILPFLLPLITLLKCRENMAFVDVSSDDNSDEKWFVLSPGLSICFEKLYKKYMGL